MYVGLFTNNVWSYQALIMAPRNSVRFFSVPDNSLVPCLEEAFSYQDEIQTVDTKYTEGQTGNNIITGDHS